MLTDRKYREHIQHVEYTRQLIERDHTDRGYTFPCNERGEMTAERTERLGKLLASGLYYDEGVQAMSWTEHVAGSGRCDCGRIVTLYGFTNTCDCGRDYNMSGDELADRSQWGEETGESVADILSVLHRR